MRAETGTIPVFSRNYCYFFKKTPHIQNYIFISSFEIDIAKFHLMSQLEKNEFLRESSETLRAIAHPLRLAIIELLHERNRLSVTEIYEYLDIEQAVASHHLRILKSKKVVDLDRDGKNSLYYLVHNDFYDIVRILHQTVVV
ncbi:MAG: metalloregulator ArsR/SmtB family transcription factor [Saprospiraceae bacterium]